MTDFPALVMLTVTALVMGFGFGVAWERRRERHRTSGIVPPQDLTQAVVPQSEDVEDYVVDRDGTKLPFTRPRKPQR